MNHTITFDDDGSQALGDFYTDIELAFRIKGTNLTQVCRTIIKRHMKNTRDPQVHEVLRTYQKFYTPVPILRERIAQYRALKAGTAQISASESQELIRKKLNT